MDFGEKMTQIENQIYDMAVSVLQKEGIPSTVGRLIMDGVYRRFVESAYSVAVQRIALLEQNLQSAENDHKKEEGQ